MIPALLTAQIYIGLYHMCIMTDYFLHWLSAVHQSQQTEPSDQSEQIGRSKRKALDRMEKRGDAAMLRK